MGLCLLFDVKLVYSVSVVNACCKLCSTIHHDLVCNIILLCCRYMYYVLLHKEFDDGYSRPGKNWKYEKLQ